MVPASLGGFELFWLDGVVLNGSSSLGWFGVVLTGWGNLIGSGWLGWFCLVLAGLDAFEWF